MILSRNGLPVREYAILAAVLIFHAALLGWGAAVHSPTWNEPAHLVAGLSHWQLGNFDLYRVNPPLVRMVAAIPCLLVHPNVDWSHYDASPGQRPEASMGQSFTAREGPRIFRLHTLARWMCIPFSLLGAVVCFLWARELYGRKSGELAAVLWCFSPNVLAHGQLITPDVGAAALGVAAFYVFWRWLKRPDWKRAAVAGLVLGLAELAKSTWIILFVLWPLLWLVARCRRAPDAATHSERPSLWQLGLILVLGLYVLNAGYGFKGSFERLGAYQFTSRALSGKADEYGGSIVPGNRFTGTVWAIIPVPLPEDYVLGVDLQRWDFEHGMWSYFRGQWRKGGWWYYYLYALAIKVPLGGWLLIALAGIAGFVWQDYATSWRDEVILLVPVAAILTLVSTQTGFNHHLRYVLPAFPFAFVWMSKIARAVNLIHRRVAVMATLATAWLITSSLWIYPHSLAYFNESVGGPRGGHSHLGGAEADSMLDWGQDLLYLKSWSDNHPELRPLAVVFHGPLDPAMLEIDWATPNHPRADSRVVLPRPGWCAVSVVSLHGRSNKYAPLLSLKADAMAGYSICIYHISFERANRLREEWGLSRFPKQEPRVRGCRQAKDRDWRWSSSEGS